ncbi:hypothetical protein F5883DRAFT_664629, partial [Diaporthe sp. PMI_573]
PDCHFPDPPQPPITTWTTSQFPPFLSASVWYSLEHTLQTMSDFIGNLPDELKLRIVEQTPLAPKAHFLKPFSNFNGALKGATIETMENFAVQVGKQENLTPIILNSDMPLGPTPEPTFIDPPTNIETPFDVDPTNLAQIKVNMVNDIFCVSSNGRDLWTAGQRFSGGVLRYRQRLNARYVRERHASSLQGLPRFDLAAGDYRCQDCGKDHTDEPERFSEGEVEFCTDCFGHWFALLKRIEEIYLVVPGLPRAQRTDTYHVFRYGELDAAGQPHEEAERGGRTCESRDRPVHDVCIRNFNGPPRDMLLFGCHIVDDFTLNGPQSFEGDGIILYEVDASAVPPQALRFMETMMQCLMAKPKESLGIRATAWGHFQRALPAKTVNA